MKNDAQPYFGDFKLGNQFRGPGRMLEDAHFFLFEA